MMDPLGPPNFKCTLIIIAHAVSILVHRYNMNFTTIHI